MVYVIIGVLQRSLAFLILPFVTRVLSPSDYGRVSVVVTTLSLVGVILGASLEVPLFRALARGGTQAERIFRWSRLYLLWLLPSLCIGVATVLWLLCLRGADGFGIWAVELASAGLTASLTFYALPVVRATDRLGLYAGLALTWMFSLVAGKLLFLGWLLPGPAGWVTSDLLSGAVAWISVLLLVQPPAISKATSDPEGSPASPWSFAVMCLPLVPHRLAFWGLTSLSRPALLLVASVKDVGLFSFAANVAAVSMTLLAELNRSVLLEYSREQFPAPSSATRQIAQTQLMAALLIPTMVAIGVTIFGQAIVGSAYYPALRLIALLLVGQVFYGVYLVPMNYLVQSAGLFRWSSFASVFGAAWILVSVLVAGSLDSLPLVALGNSGGYLVMAGGAICLVRLAKLRVNWALLLPPATIALPMTLAFAAATTSLLMFPRLDRWLPLVLALCALVVVIAMGLTTYGLRGVRQIMPRRARTK
ncbi:hypothetical protein GCM10009844_05370 [Nocardioides koreensis]|uniref:Lipopolysaccharide biosynthesis protein n=1 Tax=Nocardioides koreensis TaxID=433651 RepID=A0ABN2Z762_9ACTN